MPTILVVDDDRAIQEMLADLLRDEGYRVDTCRDGQQVLIELERHHYDLLLLDVLIPHMNGFVLMEEIRKRPALADLPVIMISGIYRSRNHRAEMTRQYKVIDYLDKPVEPERLLGLIANVLGKPDVDPMERSGEWIDDDDIIGIGDSDDPSASKELDSAPVAPAPRKSKSSKPKKEADLPDLHEAEDALGKLMVEHEREAVESEVRESFKTSAFVLQGSLKKTPVVGVLGRIWHQRAPGGLLLRRNKVKKIVYLKSGVAYGAKSNLVGECLGQVLLRERLINEAECQTSIEKMQATGLRQGEILVDMGSLTPKNLEFALQLQLETKLFETFTWDAGEYRFNSSVDLPRVGVKVEWTGPSLVAEGIRQTFDETRLRRLMLPVLDVPLALELKAVSDLDELGLPDRERAAINAIESGKTTHELLGSLPADPPDALRLIYTLIALEILRPAK